MRRNEVIQFRVSSWEKDAWTAAAAADGVVLSEWLRRLATRAVGGGDGANPSPADAYPAGEAADAVASPSQTMIVCGWRNPMVPSSKCVLEAGHTENHRYAP